MHSVYNRVAGQSVERLAARSDGIFAVAMTLLVLDLRVPANDAVHAERALWHILVALSPRPLILGSVKPRSSGRGYKLTWQPRHRGRGLPSFKRVLSLQLLHRLAPDALESLGMSQ
jgi:hypothetical protein